MFEIEEKLLKKLQTLARSYTPEWHFSQDSPDSGSVTALLFLGMLSESSRRFQRVLQKHHIQYLNLFDRLKEEPIECARSYVQFQPVPGADGSVLVPRGTQLMAESAETGQSVRFETTHSITAVNTRLESVYATDGKNDRTRKLLEGGGAENCRFTAFDATGDSQTDHQFLIAYDRLFDAVERVDATLHIQTAAPEALDKALDTLCGAGVRIALASPDGWVELSRRRINDTIHLESHLQPEKVEIAGSTRYVLGILSNTPRELDFIGVSVTIEGQELPAEEVFCGGILQNTGRFFPFGSPLAIYAECGIEQRKVLSRAGAQITMSFLLDYTVSEQLLPEPPEPPELKIIMRKPVQAPKTPILEIHADYVVLEYFGEKGWKRLIEDEHAALLFNGSTTGRVSLKFLCPKNLPDAETFTGNYRLRLRLVRADNLYKMPCRQSCPVISDLRFSYSYEEAPMPDYVCTRNGFETQDVTQRLRERRSVRLFYNHEQENPCMYLGFEGKPSGLPLSLYFSVENNADYPVDFTAEYLSDSGFLPVQVEDKTCGLLYSETMRMLVPGDIVLKSLFGQPLYWLRFINHERSDRPYRLPEIRGIRPNVAQVQNLHTDTEDFYLEREDAPLHIVLGQKNLISARVWVNEENGKTGENWVRWEKRRSAGDRGRFCTMDLAGGTIDFAKNIFAAYPVKKDGPAIRVETRAYQGGAANVPKGTISTLRTSVRYISGASNPVPAFGGYDGYNEKTSAVMIANMLRTRGRAVSEQDYFDIISQVSFGVRRIKCCSGMDLNGNTSRDTVTIAMLIDEYDKGGYIFSAVKERVTERLSQCSALAPMGKTLMLTQPRFILFSVRVWAQCERMENAYDLQKELEDCVHRFIDPLSGGFEGSGWKIGELPRQQQLLSYLKLQNPEVAVTRLAMTAAYDGREYAVDEEIYRHMDSPFAMAVNGEHTIYIELAKP